MREFTFYTYSGKIDRYENFKGILVSRKIPECSVCRLKSIKKFFFVKNWKSNREKMRKWYNRIFPLFSLIYRTSHYVKYKVTHFESVIALIRTNCRPQLNLELCNLSLTLKKHEVYQVLIFLNWKFSNPHNCMKIISEKKTFSKFSSGHQLLSEDVKKPPSLSSNVRSKGICNDILQKLYLHDEYT